MKKYTQIPTNTFEEIQENVGVLLRTFTPNSPTLNREDIIGATTGGITFTDTPTFVDYGDDIDNCPKNMMELKRIDGREITLAGTFVTADADLIKDLMATGTISAKKITASDVLETSNFGDLWWVTDYGSKGGFVAIHVMNALSTGGFSIQATDRAKGQFAFTYTAHYSMDNPDTVPYEVYVYDTAPVSA